MGKHTSSSAQQESSNARNDSIRPNLGALPTELILAIAKDLPTISAASLALCSKYLMSSLFKDHCVPLQREDKKAEREEFWRQVSRGYPDSVYCEHCNGTIHPGDKSFVTRGAFPTTCHTQDRLGQVAKFIHNDFRFITFQMIMKRHRMGLDNSTHLVHQLGFKNTSSHGGSFIESISEPRIVNNTLLLRTQHLVFFPSRDASQVSSGKLSSEYIPMCRHLEFHPTYLDFQVNHHRVSDIILYFRNTSNLYVNEQQWIDRFLEGKKSVPSRPLQACQHCTTEYRVDVQACGERSGVVIVTRWIDLGAGQSIMDPKWWSRLPSTYTSHPKFSTISRNRAGDTSPKSPSLEFERGSICEAFEQKSPLKFDPTLSSERVAKLARLHDGSSSLRRFLYEDYVILH